MSEQIDWSKAPEGCIGRGNVGAGHFYVWFSDRWYEYVDSNHGGRHYFGDTCVYSEKDIVSRTHRPPTPSWSGENLPPVGAVCEYNPMPVGKPKKWHKVEVVYASEWVIVMRCIEAPSGHEGGNGVEIAMAVDSCSLEDIRPIRTPEQIESDARIKSAQEWLKSIGLEYGEDVADQCENILMAAEEKRMDKL